MFHERISLDIMYSTRTLFNRSCQEFYLRFSKFKVGHFTIFNIIQFYFFDSQQPQPVVINPFNLPTLQHCS
ncbi:hypothetical protein EB796_025085 [Bugula neritina]|uniref:Uncharacterized protein n=1 Tax=Bugula neritina TaxID=10212 RepID=A0A7J7IRN3_BUGNE|nr:hypothetical protein EB796_025085 [Bugula neritina]